MLGRILASEVRRRAEFPVVEKIGYFAHAAVCPLPARVVDAVCTHARRAGAEGQFERLHAEAESKCRILASNLLQATPDEIAFVPCTSAGLSMVAQGLSWKPGDSVVVADRDFPANLHPWLALGSRGVEIRKIPRRPDGSIGVQDLEPLLDGSTRLVSLSSAHYAVGTPIDVDAIGQFLHSRGILFCLDAIQTLGAHPVAASQVDFLVADAHKWLLGPQGIAVMLVRSRHFQALDPVLRGWKSVRTDGGGGHGMELVASARRYEPGSLNASGLCGLAAALELLTEVGIDAVSDRIVSLRSRLEVALREAGHSVEGIAFSGDRTGILCFRPRRGGVQELGSHLESNGFALSFRADLEGRASLRLSPHFYNTEAEVDRLLELVSSHASGA